MKKKICALDGCDKKFQPQYAWSKYCSADCAYEAKVRQDYESRCKRKMKTVIKTPAWEKQPTVKWDGVQRDDDFTHEKYLKLQKEQKKKNGWKCRVCGEELRGDNRFFCDYHQEQIKKMPDRLDGNYAIESISNQAWAPK